MSYRKILKLRQVIPLSALVFLVAKDAFEDVKERDR